QIVKVWIHQEATEYDPAVLIFAKMTITEGKSDSNPIGIFTINFRGAPVANLAQTVFKGTLKSERDPVTGKVLLKFVEQASQGGGGSEGTQVTLDKAVDGSSGAGSLYMMRTENQGGTPVQKIGNFDIAYNDANFYRKDKTSSADFCLSRTSFNESAWRYGVYDSAGARVSRNSGFPIQKDGAYGWMGYWGLWLPQGVAVNNGDTVNKHDYSANTDTPYTVVKAAGKLKKHTRKTITLAEIKNIPLNWSICSGPGPCSQYQVSWTGTQFEITAEQNQSDYTWTSITPVPLDLTQLNWGELNFWSQSLGGQVRVKLNTDPANPPACAYSEGKYDCSAEGILTASTPVVFYAEDIVYPTDSIPATFACFDNCPNAGAGGVDTTTPFFASDPTNPRTYTFNSATMLLYYSGNAVVQNQTISNQTWGVMSGAMFEPSSANLNLLKCDWDANQTCGWKAWSVLPVFYTWETGLNDYNKFTALRDGSGNVVKFDPPLQITYTHQQSDVTAADYKYNGSKFYLNYSGFGNLQGIPGKCVNMNTGLDADCSGSGGNTPIQWIAAFVIPNGATATDGSATYYIKALEKSQRMKQAPGACGALSSGLASYSLPTISEWEDPAIGDEPSVTAAPAVIGGVIQ
ncbi:MAG TPA: hypothetical protein VLS90_07310, partial [Thermodesulfobacteriota bacterium]|nr:hypothetical protein [Thermodesulfobacteriota bacterium]